MSAHALNKDQRKGQNIFNCMHRATPSCICTSVSGPGFFQRPYGRVVNQHHSNQYKPMRLCLNANFLSLNICVSLWACSIQTTEDTENLEIAKSMRAGDQKQKYGLGRFMALRYS